MTGQERFGLFVCRVLLSIDVLGMERLTRVYNGGTLCLRSCLLLALLAVTVSCGGETDSGAVQGRVVILGFDGVEPSVVDALLAAGELPHLAKLKATGAYERLTSSIPPQSPAAWSSFATCSEPLQHGIYDFLRRDLRNYNPLPGFGRTEHPVLGPDGSLRQPAKAVSFRRGETFWKAADRQGIATKVLRVPFSFPADDLTAGHMLCGEGVPEIGGFTTRYFELSDAFSSEQLQENLSGGRRLALVFEGISATVDVPGAVDVTKPGNAEYVHVPMTLTVDREAATARVEVAGTDLDLKQGEWSTWLEWTFPVSPGFQVRAISCFYPLEIGARVHLYMSSLQYHPDAPYVPITAPAKYAQELLERYGLYQTIGWSHDTHALREGGLVEDAFLEEAEAQDRWLERLTLDEMAKDDFRLLISVWTATDRVAHTFWRFRDPRHPLYTKEGAERYGQAVEDTYRRMDTIVGKVMERLRPDDLFMVLSDHGFHSFHTGFSVNTWLVRSGYLALKGQEDPSTAATQPGRDLLQDVNWARTKAYGLGLGAIYLNLKGREAQGIVTPEEAPALKNELRDKLLAVVEPSSGEKVISDVYVSEAAVGPLTLNVPDLILGYTEGYQTSKVSAKGGAPMDIFEPNDDIWSGEHAASDVAATPGILFMNKPVAYTPALPDLGVTALRYLGVEVPREYTGKSLLPTPQ